MMQMMQMEMKNSKNMEDKDIFEEFCISKSRG